MDENWTAKSVKVELLSGTCALKDKEEIDVLHQNGDFHARKTAAGEKKGQMLKSVRSRIGATNNWQTLAKKKKKSEMCLLVRKAKTTKRVYKNQIANF